MKKSKVDDVSTSQEPIVKLSNINENDGIFTWTYDTKRVKSYITEDSLELMKKIGDSKPKDLELIKEMINLHNEYRFPLVQLTNTSQKNVDIAYEFLIFLSEVNG